MTRSPEGRRALRSAKAPGKLLLSGAYSVLEGAPALVTAVDRWVTADPTREAEQPTDEVRQALEGGDPEREEIKAPWFDASALRAETAGGSRKLGLGSSGAILVASLGALLSGTYQDESDLRAAVLPRALDAHRAAQGGGSGVDVAASVHGGVLRCSLLGGRLLVMEHVLPPGAQVEVFASAASASTPALIAELSALRKQQPARTDHALEAAARAAVLATSAATTSELTSALDAQFDAFAKLSPDVPIVLAEVAALRPLAAHEGAAFGPSGAGGGDVAIYVGGAPSSEEFRRAAVAEGLHRLDVGIAARGLHLI